MGNEKGIQFAKRRPPASPASDAVMQTHSQQKLLRLLLVNGIIMYNLDYNNYDYIKEKV